MTRNRFLWLVEILDSKKLSPKAVYTFETPAGAARLALIANYELSIEVPDNLTIELGRFSLSCISKIRTFGAANPGSKLTIGAFCEAAEGVRILAGGEHRNSSVLNYSFGGSFNFFREFMDKEALEHARVPYEGISLGENVLLGNGAVVLDGVSIGDGSVVAAHAAVVSSPPENVIVGGVPARVLKNRLPDQRFAMLKNLRLRDIRGHCLPMLPSLISRFEQGLLAFEEIVATLEYMDRRPKLVIPGRLGSDGEILLGLPSRFFIGDEEVTDDKNVRQLSSYFRQLKTEGSETKWSPDVFYSIGIS